MSGKGSGIDSYQVQVCIGRICRGRAVRGYRYYWDTTKHKALCSVLGIHVFGYNQKTS